MGTLEVEQKLSDNIFQNRIIKGTVFKYFMYNNLFNNYFNLYMYFLLIVYQAIIINYHAKSLLTSWNLTNFSITNIHYYYLLTMSSITYFVAYPPLPPYPL